MSGFVGNFIEETKQFHRNQSTNRRNGNSVELAINTRTDRRKRRQRGNVLGQQVFNL